MRPRPACWLDCGGLPPGFCGGTIGHRSRAAIDTIPNVITVGFLKTEQLNRNQDLGIQ